MAARFVLLHNVKLQLLYTFSLLLHFSLTKISGQAVNLQNSSRFQLSSRNHFSEPQISFISHTNSKSGWRLKQRYSFSKQRKQCARIFDRVELQAKALENKYGYSTLRGAVGSVGQADRIASLLNKSLTGHRLRVSTVGGSISAGNGLKNPSQHFAALLSHSLNSLFPALEATAVQDPVISLSIPAAGSYILRFCLDELLDLQCRLRGGIEERRGRRGQEVGGMGGFESGGGETKGISEEETRAERRRPGQKWQNCETKRRFHESDVVLVDVAVNDFVNMKDFVNGSFYWSDSETLSFEEPLLRSLLLLPSFPVVILVNFNHFFRVQYPDKVELFRSADAVLGKLLGYYGVPSVSVARAFGSLVLGKEEREFEASSFSDLLLDRVHPNPNGSVVVSDFLFHLFLSEFSHHLRRGLLSPGPNNKGESGSCVRIPTDFTPLPEPIFCKSCGPAFCRFAEDWNPEVKEGDLGSKWSLESTQMGKYANLDVPLKRWSAKEPGAWLNVTLSLREGKEALGIAFQKNPRFKVEGIGATVYLNGEEVSQLKFEFQYKIWVLYYSIARMNSPGEHTISIYSVTPGIELLAIVAD